MNKHRETGYDLILRIIPEGARVLDLGCGDGTLLYRLQKNSNVRGFGVEISEDGVSRCVEKGLYCYQADIDEGLTDYKENSFDYIILNQTIQSTKRPEYVVKEIMRIGKKAIISFPNFAYISIRCQFMTRGSMPKTPMIPYEWYESPNIHMLTINDFDAFCRKNGFPVNAKKHFTVTGSKRSRKVKIAPNLFAQYGFFILDGEKYKGG